MYYMYVEYLPRHSTYASPAVSLFGIMYLVDEQAETGLGVENVDHSAL